MPQEILSFEDADGTISVELIDPAQKSTTYRGGAGSPNITKATKSFDKALDSVRAIANKAKNTFKDIADSPDEISLEMGIKITAEAGAVLAAVGGEVHFKIEIKWTKDKPSSSPVEPPSSPAIS